MEHTIHGFVEKFGGYPWGFPIDKWPVCKWCKKPKSFIAQLKHDTERLNLGRQDYLLYLFSCQEDFDENDECVYTITSDELSGNWTKPNSPTIIYPEVIITEWIKEEEEIDQLSCDPFDILAYSISDDLEKIYSGTKVGGFPSWFQTGPLSFISKPCEYLLQQDEYIDLICETLSADSIGYSIVWLNEQNRILKKDQPKNFKYTESLRQSDIYVGTDGTIFTEIGFYGNGTAYVMIDRTENPPELFFFTECT